jgi:hypothetical protein
MKTNIKPSSSPELSNAISSTREKINANTYLPNAENRQTRPAKPAVGTSTRSPDRSTVRDRPTCRYFVSQLVCFLQHAQQCTFLAYLSSRDIFLPRLKSSHFDPPNFVFVNIITLYLQFYSIFHGSIPQFTHKNGKALLQQVMTTQKWGMEC